MKSLMTLEILICSLLLISLVFVSGWKKFLKFNWVSEFFSVIKNVSVVFLKMTMMMLVFLVTNHFSYIYFGVGISMGYLSVLIVSGFLLLFLWCSMISKNFSMMMSHFLPLGVNGVSKIFIPLIEILGVLIRPITLAVRLATNISCGHAVLLMFSYFLISSNFIMVNMVWMLLTCLLFIEFLVCVIQAYVFWSLLYIYIMDIEI